MALIGKVCSRGVWDETVPGITFDANGVSNYAKLYLELVNAYPRGETGKKNWDSFVTQIKEKGKNKKYDCIIGVSGGTDSSYLLHLAKEYGLRPLAVNLDNGWNSDIAVKNIKKMISALNIDLETYVIDYEEIKDLMRSYMYAGLPWIDIPTDLAIMGILYKIANKNNIKFILRGNDFRTEGSQPREWTYGDGRQLRYVHKKFGTVKLKTFPNYTLTNLIYFGFFKKIKSLYPFYYLDYNKKNTQEFLSKTYGWEYYGGHHHENLFTKFSISYWMYEKFSIDKRKITLSALILANEIKRNDAVSELKESPCQQEEQSTLIKYTLKKLGFDKTEFENIMKNKNHTFQDYPSNFFLINNLLKYTKPLLKFIFKHKPQSVFQSEMRKRKI